MDQDPQVKKEVDEAMTRIGSPEELGAMHLHPHSRSADEEGHLTLALLPQPSPPRKPKVSFSTGKLKEKKRKALKINFKTKLPGLKAKEVTPDLARKCTRCKKNVAADGFISPAEFKSPALIRAEEVQSNLESTFPSFVKPLVRSHVGSCFWMGLPGLFCRAHLPNKDCAVTLEDEYGNQYEIKYIAYKTGLSAGWRQFCVSHQLLEGDVLVFQLVQPTKFKVYIIRANDFTEVDGALGLLNLDTHTKQKTSGSFDTRIASCSCSKRKQANAFPLSAVPKRNKMKGAPSSGLGIAKPAEQSENDSEEVGSEVLEGFKLSRPSLHFTDIGNIENFRIIVNGMSLDSELSEDIRIKYYDLCCSQNAFLHENFITGNNFRLIMGAITEVVNIADAIRVCKFTTSRDEFSNWDKTLEAFGILGMNVGFLRARLQRLVSLAYESEDAKDTKRYIEARSERERTEKEIKNLEARLLELKEESQRVSVDIVNLKSIAESHELKFQEVVTASW